jgi:arabinoxylan arabinofuranohydrolase
MRLLPVFASFALISSSAFAAPSTQGQINLPFAMPDVNVVADGDIAYAFCGTDVIPYDKGVTDFVMPYWRCFSSTDLVNWHFESMLRPEDTYIGTSSSCWAGHGIKKGDRWFWYLSNKSTDTGVATADSLKGPWKDALGKPLLPASLTDTHEYDSCVMTDDDGASYIVFGSQKKGEINYHIARLNPDMISLAETPRKIVVTGDVHKAAHIAVDAPFLHKAEGRYYLSWRRPYAISDSIYGPYHFVGNQDAQGHGGFFRFRNQWFVNYTTLQPECRQKYRFASLAYVHYRADGSIAPIEPTTRDLGVGQYDASWKAIEAECHMGTTNTVLKREHATGFDMRNLRCGDFLHFPNIRNVARDAVIEIKYSSAAAASSANRIAVHIYEPNGPRLCH